MSPGEKSRCNECGHCCSVVVNIYPMSEHTVEWAMARGFRMIDSSDKYVAVEIPAKCPHLSSKSRCKLQHKKPETCRLYPSFLTEEELKRLGLRLDRILGKGCGYVNQATKE